jgi:hypothetical protein
LQHQAANSFKVCSRKKGDVMTQAYGTRWEADRAWDWYRSRAWPCGFNYVTSTAINTTELWQGDTFDPDTMDRELGWAQELGFNTCRIFIQYLVWQHDPEGLMNRLERFLQVASKHGISTMFCLFDDCAFAGKQPYLGKQDEPAPGVHNSGWTPSPGHERVVDRTVWPKLEDYVTSVVSRFSQDARVVAWDLYNEPGNANMGDKSLPLLREAFQWARGADPQQPLTTGIWHPDLAALNEAITELSDILTFHNYSDLGTLKKQVVELREFGYPLVCTEWMARTRDSLFETHLPFLKQERIGCYSWGLVNGKTQTHFPWGWPQGGPEPDLWFHDIFYADGRPYSEEEIEAIRRHCRGD